jgi:hypothetical protein
MYLAPSLSAQGFFSSLIPGLRDVIEQRSDILRQAVLIDVVPGLGRAYLCTSDSRADARGYVAPLQYVEIDIGSLGVAGQYGIPTAFMIRAVLQEALGIFCLCGQSERIRWRDRLYGGHEVYTLFIERGVHCPP